MARVTQGPPITDVHIALSVENATKGLPNKVEMAFRAYDPCFDCATDALPGHTPLKVRIHNHHRQLVREISQE
jgi:coenzyme F420-reducing hydrogenase alpha subunit